MIYPDRNFPSLPTVYRREGNENCLWKHIPTGDVAESIDNFQVLEQDEQLYFFSIGRNSQSLWNGKKITQKEFNWIQNASEKDLWFFTQP